MLASSPLGPRISSTSEHYKFAIVHSILRRLSLRHTISLQPTSATLVSSLELSHTLHNGIRALHTHWGISFPTSPVDPYLPMSYLPLQGTMLCCSSCSLPIQGHQVPRGAKCSILFDEASHTSGLKPECTVCLQPWGSHLQGKHIPKDCKFNWQQALGDMATDNLEPVEDGDVHSRLARITQENQAIKVQLSQLTELVQQLLPQSGQAAPQPAGMDNTPGPAPQTADQATSSSRAEASLPPPSWSHSGDSAMGVTPRDHQLLPSSYAGQNPVLPHSNPLPAVSVVLASNIRQGTTEVPLQQPWPSPVSPSALPLGSTFSLQ